MAAQRLQVFNKTRMEECLIRESTSSEHCKNPIPIPPPLPAPSNQLPLQWEGLLPWAGDCPRPEGCTQGRCSLQHLLSLFAFLLTCGGELPPSQALEGCRFSLAI